MIPVGAADQWVDFIDTLVPEILELVVDTWSVMPSFQGDQREDPTTEELCRRLRLQRASAELPFRIDTQLAELDPAAGEDQGRMDIVFSPMVPREDIYFCLECKRLNVIRDGAMRAYASEYVTHGMLRFVRGQYAAIVRQGGMLGYVMDGDVARAISNVSSAVERRRTELGMDGADGLRPSSIRQDDSAAKETLHRRSTSCAPEFRMHHIFVSRPISW